MLGIIITLSILAFILGTACLVLDLSQYRRYTVEAGEKLTAADIVGYEGASFGDDFDPEYLNHAGAYYFTVHSKDRDIRIRLKVQDTKAPEITVKKVDFAVGGKLPDPLDFVDTVVEADDFTGEFLTPMPEFKSLGEYKMKVRYTDASGNKTKVFEVTMRQIYDSEPPRVKVKGDVIAYLNESVVYSDYLTLSDNCVGDIRIEEVDVSELDLTKEGEYDVTVVAIDGLNNRSREIELRVKVIAREVDDALLNERISEIIDDIVDEDDSAEEKCRDIHAYLQRNITYTGSSDKSDWRRAAYNALFVSGEGDCFSYFSAAKALLEYCGIENKDIQRTRGYTPDTHYWSLVNIGEDGEDAWYHFDATVLRDDKYKHSGCLLTDKQVDAYSKVRESFYKYDRGAYPATKTEIITPTPSLEAFY
jgi:transglutaminase-like putative cysteine protease